MTSFTPAAISLNGAASRELPHPFDCPLTTTANPPLARLPLSTVPPRSPISENCPSVSS